MSTKDKLERNMLTCVRHTLPVFMEDPSRGIFSAVPLTIGEARFLLTAGHCLESDMLRAGPWIIGGPHLDGDASDGIRTISSIPATISGSIVGRHTFDVGVARIEPLDEDACERFDAAAVPLDRVKFILSTSMTAKDEVVVTGYPGDAASGIGGPLLTPLSLVALFGDSLEEPGPDPATKNPFRIDVAFPVDRLRDANNENANLPRLRGVSGGGYWTDEDGELFLVGTHAVSTDQAFYVGDEVYRVGHGFTLHIHFSLIMDRWPELEGAITSRWPTLVQNRLVRPLP